MSESKQRKNMVNNPWGKQNVNRDSHREPYHNRLAVPAATEVQVVTAAGCRRAAHLLTIQSNILGKVNASAIG